MIRSADTSAVLTGLVSRLLEQRENRTLQRLQKQPERLDLILLDELDQVPFTKAGAELLFDVVRLPKLSHMES